MILRPVVSESVDNDFGRGAKFSEPHFIDLAQGQLPRVRQ